MATASSAHSGSTIAVPVTLEKEPEGLWMAAVRRLLRNRAAVIGLIIWMQLSAVIIFLGAAWNAELAESRRGTQAHA